MYRRATNSKNGDPYFNLVKKDIIDCSDYTITLENGHILRKSCLAVKGKFFPVSRNRVHRTDQIRPFFILFIILIDHFTVLFVD